MYTSMCIHRCIYVHIYVHKHIYDHTHIYSITIKPLNALLTITNVSSFLSPFVIGSGGIHGPIRSYIIHKQGPRLTIAKFRAAAYKVSEVSTVTHYCL
jgi:hypothetical protein